METVISAIAKSLAGMIAMAFTALIVHPIVTLIIAASVYFGIYEHSLVVAGAVFGGTLVVLVIVHLVFKSRSRLYSRAYSMLRGWRTKVLARRAMRKSLKGSALDSRDGDAFVKQPRIKSVEVGD